MHQVVCATTNPAKIQAILQALIAEDWKTARKALSYHIKDNHPILSKIVKQS